MAVTIGTLKIFFLDISKYHANNKSYQKPAARYESKSRRNIEEVIVVSEKKTHHVETNKFFAKL